MNTTALLSRRRLASVLASALALGGLVAFAPTATAAQTGSPIAESGVATWGISDYLNSGNPGRPAPSAANYTAPATFTAATKLSTFGQGTGTVAADGSATLAFKGSTLNWAAGTGNGWLQLADLEATFDATGAGTVSAEVTYGTSASDSVWSETPSQRGPQRIVIENLTPDAEGGDAVYPASLSSQNYAFNETASAYTWTGLIGRWSNEFIAFLAGDAVADPVVPGWSFKSTVVNNVVNNVIRYPAALSFTIDRTVAATTVSPTVDGDAINIGVNGTGFLKSAPGLYVSLRERTPGDSAYAGQSLPMDAPTAWVSNSAADVGTGEQSAAASIGDDGSFSAVVPVSPAVVAALDPAKSYTIVTRKAHGQGASPTHASQVTETPVDIAGLKQTTTVTAPDVTAAAGTTAVVDVTVAPETSGTPTGAVQVLDGETVKGTGTLTNGAASLSVSGLGVGTKTYTLVYQGASGYWRSAGSVDITVGKVASAITVGGPASVAYRAGATYTANVSAGTGNVTITGAGVGFTRPIVAGTATFVLPTTLPAGVRTLTFGYAGDASTNAATSVNKKITIAKGATSLAAAVTSKWSAIKAGKFTIMVKSVKGGPVPTGKVSVVLKKGTKTKVLTAKVLVGGKVVFTLPKSAKGTWSVKVTYLGSTQHVGVSKTWLIKVPAK